VAERTKIPLETIEAVKKKLRKLPEKNPGKSVKEALELLAADFQNTLKKGYSVKELRGFLVEEKLVIPFGLIKGVALAEQDKPIKKNGAKAGREETKIDEAPAYAITIKPDTPDTEL
jgi:hypothetical protein